MKGETLGPGVWVVRGGDNNELASQVKGKRHVGVGWNTLGDISNFPTRDAIKRALEESEPGSGTPTAAGQTFRFANEIKDGDYVLTPEKNTRAVHVSQCVGAYRHDTSVFGEDYPNVIPVKYLREVPRKQFSQVVRNTLGSTLTVFRADIALKELEAILGGQKPTPVEEPEQFWPDQMEAEVQGQILEALDEIEHHNFQVFIAGVLEALGYKTRVGKKGKDGGVDVIAYPDVFGLASPRIKVQTKNQKNLAGIQDVGYLNGVLGTGERGLFICTGGFSPDAKNAPFVASGSVALVDGRQLLEIILEHYEDFPATAKGLLPLRRLYIPDRSAPV